MQEKFLHNKELVDALRASLSDARFARYLADCGGKEVAALKLYHWNAQASQAFYLPLQMWEVALRNRLNRFLIWKYNDKWPYDSRCIRNLAGPEQRRLEETKQRQAQKRGVDPVPTDALVADLSVGFWSGLLLKSYEVPYAWRPNANLVRIFPHDPKIGRENASEICERLLVLRNRIAHHEAIYQFDLADRWNDLQRILAAMCSGTAEYAKSECRVDEVIAAKPQV